MKEKYTHVKANDPTTYISNSDVLIYLEDAYNKISLSWCEEVKFVRIVLRWFFFHVT